MCELKGRYKSGQLNFEIHNTSYAYLRNYKKLMICINKYKVQGKVLPEHNMGGVTSTRKVLPQHNMEGVTSTQYGKCCR